MPLILPPGHPGITTVVWSKLITSGIMSGLRFRVTWNILIPVIGAWGMMVNILAGLKMNRDAQYRFMIRTILANTNPITCLVLIRIFGAVTGTMMILAWVILQPMMISPERKYGYGDCRAMA